MFKVGDKVVVKVGGNKFLDKYNGKAATVTAINRRCSLGRGVSIDIDNGIYVWLDDELEAIEEDAMKFKVGDKVRIVDRGIFRYNYRVGDTATIESIHDDLFVLSMRGGGKQNVLISHADEYIEKLEECAMKFKVGDRVMVDGLTGEISDIDTEDSTYLVGGCWYDEEDLTAAPSKLAELLGVKDDTPFNIVDSDGDDYTYSPYVVHDGKLIDREGDECGVFTELLNGEAKVVPLGDEWYEGRTLYYVDSCGNVDEIDYDRCNDLCVALVLLGNAFTTFAGAKSAAERINADIIEKLGEC